MSAAGPVALRVAALWLALLAGAPGVARGQLDGDDAAPSGQSSPGREGGFCRVERIVSGDTLECEDGRTIRLLLIDAPEMGQGIFGVMARETLAAMLPVGRYANVELDADPADRTGRTLAYLFRPDGRLVNEEMARRGYAVELTYPPNVRYLDRVRAAVDQARAASAGLWRSDGFRCRPRDHRAGRCE